MKCSLCDGKLQEKNDMFKYDDQYVGMILILGKRFYKCGHCAEYFLTEEMSEAIERERETRIKEYLLEIPIKEYFSSSETATFLHITRQALHKNMRINRGFIYQLMFGGVKVYLKKSVLLFKNCGDGRFPIHQPTFTNDLLYGFDFPRHSGISKYTGVQRATLPLARFIEKKPSFFKENSYVN